MTTDDTNTPTSTTGKDTNQDAELLKMAEIIWDLTVTSWQAHQRQRDKESAELTESEFVTLDLLSKQQPLTIGDLQRAIGVLPAQMSRIIRSLEKHEKKPLITCSINPDDKRKVDVELTDAGAKLHDTIKRTRLANSVRILSQLDPHDRHEFVRIIGEIRKVFAKDMQQTEA